MLIPLRVRSNYSFLEGASDPEDLVEACARWGIPAMALADRDGVYGVARAWVRGRELGVHVIGGVSPTLHAELEVVVLARDARGWGNLCEATTRAQSRAEKGAARWTFDDLPLLCDSTHVLWSCRSATPGEEARGWVRRIAELRGSTHHAMIARHGAPGEAALERATRALAARTGARLVAAQRVLYHAATRRMVQDALTCERFGVDLASARGLLMPNGSHGLEAPRRTARRFADDPELVRETRRVAAECGDALGALEYRYPSVGGARGERAELAARVLEGARWRYDGEPPEDVRAQLERELDLVADLGYGGYFLTMHEIVGFCRANGILCQGRGSAANSAICYCLGITAVDPVRMGLLFERFLSRERAEPPDIDLDIAHQRREEVIQHVYATYGRRRAAMLSNAVRFRAKSAVRTAGAALGLGPQAVDALARQCGRGERLDMALVEKVGLDPKGAARWLPWLARELEGTPRHMSIHPGGFLLARGAVDRLVAVEPATMPGRTVVQWDKYDVEALEWFKVDLLGLGALTMLDDALELVREHEGEELTMATIPAGDPETYAMISRGDTVGVFQIESRAQMSMLPRLRPRSFYDLVIEISIVRPGPIVGDMVHPYLRRREGKAPVTYPHPSLEPVLARTLGIPLFQEQVMQLAMVAAGYTAGEADQLRRDMGAWKSGGRIRRHRDRLIQGMSERGISEDFANRIFKQIQGFASYGFPESHAASFALVAYATAYVRRHHPEAFLCSLLNAQPMGFYRPSTLVNDARRRGVRVLGPSANASRWRSTIEHDARGLAVRLGLATLRGLKERHADELVRERERAGDYEGPEDLARRTDLPERTLLGLARAAAFDGMSRRDALWRARAAAARRHDLLALAPREQTPRLRQLGLFDEITADLRAGRASPRGHPLGPLRDRLSAAGIASAARLEAIGHGAWAHTAGVVIARQRPPTASGTMFLTLEDETGLASVIVWPDLYEVHKATLRGAPALEVWGRIQHADGVTHLIAQKVAPFELAHAERWR